MKTYVKPDLYYEDFELSHSIASCNVTGDDTKNQTNATDGNTCTYDFIGDILFLDANTNCTIPYDVAGESFCYQTGTDSFNFFSS